MTLHRARALNLEADKRLDGFLAVRAHFGELAGEILMRYATS